MAVSRNKYSSNPFEEEEDDWGFGTRGQPSRDPFDDEDSWGRPMTAAERLQMQKEKSMNNQMASTQRALASIYDSEQTGIATAEELVRQGEQLDNIEKKTHAINQDMKQTQKSLNSIKSVFGSIKNWWGGKKEEPRQEFQPPPRNSQLRDTVDAHQSTSEHPALRMRTDDYQGFYQDDRRSSGASGGYGGAVRGTAGGASGTQQKSSMVAYEEQMDTNLAMMSDGLSRLKNLGLGLESEIDQQNQQLDRIDVAVNRADNSIRNQNRQMNTILGNKKK